MFKSLRSKLIAFMAMILLFTASMIIYFTHRDVGREILRIEDKNVENVLNSVFLNIEGVYRGVITDRLASIEESKVRLKREMGFVLSVLDLHARKKRLFDQVGSITPGRDLEDVDEPERNSELEDNDKSKAEHGSESEDRFKGDFVQWLGRLDMGTTSFVIADANHEVFFDSEHTLVSQNLARVRDIKGLPLSALINHPDAAYIQYVVFSPESAGDGGGDIQKLGFLSRFQDWDWVLGAFVDISHIQAMEKSRLDQLIKGLNDQFKKTRIAHTGSLFIFDRNDELIIPPHRVDNVQALQAHFSTLAQNAGQNGASKITVEGDEIIAYSRFFRPLNWYLTALVPAAEIQAPAEALVRRQSVVIAGVFLLSILAAVLLVRHISGPLVVLAEQARELAGQDLTTDDYDPGQIAGLTQKYRDEVGALAGSFLFMQEELKKNVRSLVETTAAKERYQSELSLAREIQMSILPKIFPPFPEIKAFDLFALLEPAREVGGDLYDFFMMDEHHLCFTVGDVSDKGMPAALYMAITRTLIQSHAAKESSPARIMALVNNDLSKDNPKSMFVTLILGIMDIRTGRIMYANAGHNLPILLDNAGECSFVHGISGPVAGAIEDMIYKELHLDLKPGESLFVYTDGVTEAMNSDQELFSDERLLQDTCRAGTRDVEELVHTVRERVVEFVAGAPQSDDITMLMLTYHGYGNRD